MENTEQRAPMKGAKVLPLPGCESYALFAPKLRQQLQEGVKSYTQQPKETVDTFEQVLCTYLVAGLRQAANRLATAAGEKLAGKIARRLPGG